MTDETETITDEQAQRIGELYGEALSNYDSLGDFQLALTNSMSYRSYNWRIDQLEAVLEVMVELESSTQSPRSQDWEEWDELMDRKSE